MIRSCVAFAMVCCTSLSSTRYAATVCAVDASRTFRWKCPYCDSVSAAAAAAGPSEVDYVQPSKALLSILDKVQIECPACSESVEHGSMTHHVTHACSHKERFIQKQHKAPENGLCITCREMFAAPGQKDKCSVCFVTAHHKEANFDAHPLSKKQKLIAEAARVKWDMTKLDELFAAHRPDHVILTSRQATIFINTYKTKSLHEILAAFLGRHDLPPFVLRAVDADRLLDALNSRLSKEYMLVHLVAPRILDRWAVSKYNTLIECYWGIKTPPQSLDKLHDLWRDVGTASSNRGEHVLRRLQADLPISPPSTPHKLC
jgi:hypothetical protein